MYSTNKNRLGNIEKNQTFEDIFKKHYADVFVFIKKYTLGKDQAEDIAQESFIKLWKIQKTDYTTTTVFLLYKIAYNIFIDKYREKKKEKDSLDLLFYKKQLELIPENNEVLMKKRKFVLKAINELPPKCREVFLMSKQQGYKYREIAEILNISVKTVESQISKGFSILRKKLKTKGDFLFFLNFLNQL